MSITSSSPRCTDAKSPAAITTSASAAISASLAACRLSRCTSLNAPPDLVEVGEAEVGHPLVAEGDDAVEHVLPVAPHEHGRMGLLHGLRPRPDRVEAHALPVVLRLVLGPDGLHRLDPLAHQRE